MTVTLYDERGSVVRTTDPDLRQGATDLEVRDRFGATLLYADGDRGVVGAYCKASGRHHPVQRYAEGDVGTVTVGALEAFVDDVTAALAEDGAEPRPLAETDPGDTHRPFARIAGGSTPEDVPTADAGLEEVGRLLDADTPVDVAVAGDGYDPAVEVFELLVARFADEGVSVALTSHGRVAALDGVDVVVRPEDGEGGGGGETVRVPSVDPVRFEFADSTAALVRSHRVEAAAADLAAAIDDAAAGDLDESTVYDRARAGLAPVAGDVVRARGKAVLAAKWLAVGLLVGVAAGFAFRRTIYAVEDFYWSNPQLSKRIAAGVGLAALLAVTYAVTQRTEGWLNRSVTGDLDVSLSFSRIVAVVTLLVLALLLLARAVL